MPAIAAVMRSQQAQTNGKGPGNGRRCLYDVVPYDGRTAGFRMQKGSLECPDWGN